VNFPDKLQPLFFTTKRFIPIFGGRDSGKSWGASAKTVMKAGEGAKCVGAREIASLLDSNIKSLIEGSIERLKAPGFKITDKKIVHRSGGSIVTMGLKGGSKTDTRTRIKGLEDIDWFWGEEAEAFTDETLKILIPTIRKPGSQQCYTFNRFLDLDPVFKRLCQNLDPRTTEKININYYDNPFCPEEEYYEAEKLKESDYDLWLHIYGGEPMSQSDKAVLSRIDVMHAMGRKPDTEGGVEIGADIARYGDDMTVFFKRRGMTVTDIKEYKKQSIPETARKLMDFAGVEVNHLAIPIKVDDSGLGGGVADILRENGFNTVPVNNGQTAKNSNKYPNAISEQWFEFAKMINEVVLPDHSRLKMELTSRFFKIDTRSRRCIESKEDYKKRGFKSPDYADACLLCFYNKQAGTFSDIPEPTFKPEMAGLMNKQF
jgi:phage terminase large subunit